MQEDGLGRATDRWVRSAGRWLARLEDELPGLLVGLMTLLVLADVVMRYVVREPIRGTAELAATFFVWAVLLGSASAARNDVHVRMDLFEMVRSARTRLLLDCVTRCLSILIAGVLTVLAVQYFLDAKNSELPLLGISYGYVVLAAPVGLWLIAMHDLVFFVANVRVLLSSREAQESLVAARRPAEMPI